MSEDDAQPVLSPLPPRRRPRWGLRTLGFLTLGMIAMITASATGGYTVGSLGSLIFGVLGAGYCSIKGVRQARERGLYGVLMDRRPRR
jgi:peptidoglycan/LPS O-acetylase OafA/YrhL